MKTKIPTLKFSDMKSLKKALYKPTVEKQKKNVVGAIDKGWLEDRERWNKSKIREDVVPTVNAAGNGGIDGIGIGPKGEPGVKKKPKNHILRRSKFAGNVVFEVDNTTYHKSMYGKKKWKHWKSYVMDEEVCDEIREYAYQNPDKPIIIQNEMTGAMQYIRYGKTK